MRPALQLTTAVAILLAARFATAQPSATNRAPADLVRKVVQHELHENAKSTARFQFKDQRTTPHVSQVKLMVETREATAGLIVAQNGAPLNAEQRQAEKARLRNYVNHPDELNRKRRQEREDAERTTKIIKAMPDAFLYQADGTQPGTATVGRQGHDLVRLKFRPNPDYDPPSRVEQVLTGMQGTLLIDANEDRIAEIDGTLQKQVGFGWGILGHLDRGGRFLVQQADVGNGHWEVTRMELLFTGKILLFKSLNIRSTDIFSDFKPVPFDLTFAQGVDLLEKWAAEQNSQRQSKLAENSGQKEHDPAEDGPDKNDSQPWCRH